MKVTVYDLIQLLQELPLETVCYLSTWQSNQPFDRSEIEGPYYHFPISVYEKDGEIRLYFDDGEASHPDIDQNRDSLFWAGEAWARIRALRS